MKKHCQNITISNTRREDSSLVEDPKDSERLLELDHVSRSRSSAIEPRGSTKPSRHSGDPPRSISLQEAKDPVLARTLQEQSPPERRRSARSTGAAVSFLSPARTKRTTRSEKPSKEGMKEAAKRPLEMDEDVRANKRKKSLQLPERPWSRPLIYPPSGLGRTPVEYDDLHRLNPEEWLNDNIINFYMK